MIFPKKTSSPLNNNKNPKIKEFIIAINSLNYSIKSVYTDFSKNIEKEYYFINLLESKIDKSNLSLIEAINYLRIYIDLDKKSLDDFFAEAKIIFKKMKIIFASLKQLINNNNQYHYINTNIFPQKILTNNYNMNNNITLRQIKNSNNNINNVIMRPKARTPIKSISNKNSSISLTSQNSFKKYKLELSEKEKLINNLKSKLKILKENYSKLNTNLNIISKQKIESEKRIKELSNNYEELKKKYSQLELNCYDFKSDDRKNSNYEEEFDLKMIAKGAKEKNFSQDMNIDNPGLLAIKEKFREFINKYNTLVDLVKNLIPRINKNTTNENIISDIIKIIFGNNLKN